MAAPMTPASPTRSQQIAAKEKAVKDRLNKANTDAKNKATKQVADDYNSYKKKHPKDHGNRTFSSSYDTQSISNYTDFGIGKGAGIPYHINDTKHTIKKTVGTTKKSPWGTPLPGNYSPGPSKNGNATPAPNNPNKVNPTPPKPRMPGNIAGNGPFNPNADVTARLAAIRRRAATTNTSPTPGNVIPIQMGG